MSSPDHRIFAGGGEFLTTLLKALIQYLAVEKMLNVPPLRYLLQNGLKYNLDQVKVSIQ